MVRRTARTFCNADGLQRRIPIGSETPDSNFRVVIKDRSYDRQATSVAGINRNLLLVLHRSFLILTKTHHFLACFPVWMPDIQDIGVATPGTGTGPPILGGTGRWISAKPLRKCFIEVGYISEENTLMCKDVVDDLFYSSETFLFENFDLSPLAHIPEASLRHWSRIAQCLNVFSQTHTAFQIIRQVLNWWRHMFKALTVPVAILLNARCDACNVNRAEFIDMATFWTDTQTRRNC